MKILWVLLALVGISFGYITNTVSLFSGEHAYYTLDDNLTQMQCTKCHGDISIELHTGYIHANFTCADCHRAMPGVQYANATTPGTLAHAASSIQCADCHSEFLNNTSDTIHNAFINYGMQHNTSENCIACHASIAVSINWTRPDALNIETTSDGSNLTINQTYKSFTAVVETFGNQSGDAIAVSNVTVI